MPFEPLKLAKHGGSSLTIDVQRRLRVSRAAMTELKLSAYQYVVISVDVENKRIGLAKQELAKVPNASAVKIDKRGYLGTKAGKEIVAKLALTGADLPAKFADIGWEDQNGVRWRGFEMESKDYFGPIAE
ncbi:hypothetical protein [Neobacillus sp. DY30]|uniref:hypothetical protein n=1 Tax=Neobacillus sp. DY30 TaxID=3047871 RepID=UPI0024BF5088|nr:hypothetical protein [Neobacillus sp. DY30]WHY01853.1 hypothetical protein QNH29_06390 [Neobacillus sp. DY30]